MGDLQFDIQHRRVTRGSEQISLSPRELDVLQVLMQEPGRIFSRQYILDNIYQDYRVVGDRTVDGHIKKLRKKF